MSLAVHKLRAVRAAKVLVKGREGCRDEVLDDLDRVAVLVLLAVFDDAAEALRHYKEKRAPSVEARLTELATMGFHTPRKASAHEH